MLTTAYMRVEIDSSVLTCEFRLNQSGNLDIEDNAYIQYQVNDGEWVTQYALSGYGLDAVWYNSFMVKLYFNEYVRFRVVYETNDNTEFWALQNGDINITGDFTVYSSFLPVEFISLTSLSDEKTIVLNWITASETNNDYFTVERSENGLDFDVLDIVAGAGNSNTIKEYIFNDPVPLNGTSYYRIKQTDYDGKYSYSEITSVEFNTPSDKMIVSSENGFLTIRLTSEKESEVALSIFELNGKEISNKIYRINKGENQLNISNEMFSKNIYIIHLMKSVGTSSSTKCFLN